MLEFLFGNSYNCHNYVETGEFMDFYTLTYLQEQNNVAQFVQYGIVVIIFLVLTIATILYIKDKFQTKYRDLSIIMALILFLWQE